MLGWRWSILMALDVEIRAAEDVEEEKEEETGDREEVRGQKVGSTEILGCSTF